MSRLPRQIVCAAVKLKDGRVICGVRHFDVLMRAMIDSIGKPDKVLPGAEQGFVDNDYLFLDRNEAWKVAEAAGQIRSPTVQGCLFSEDLY